MDHLLKKTKINIKRNNYLSINVFVLIFVLFCFMNCSNFNKSDQYYSIFLKSIADNGYPNIYELNVVGYGFIEQNELLKKINKIKSEYQYDSFTENLMSENAYNNFYNYIDTRRGELLFRNGELSDIGVGALYSKDFSSSFRMIGWYTKGLKKRTFLTSKVIIDNKTYCFYILLKGDNYRR